MEYVRHNLTDAPVIPRGRSSRNFSMTVANSAAATKLGTASHRQPRRSRRYSLRRNLTIFPPLALALFPKCPFCLMAYFGVFGSVGLGSSLYITWLLPLSFIFLGLAVGALAFGSSQCRGYRPFFLGLIAAAIILLAKFYLANGALTYCGMALLFVASFWNSWPLKRSGTRAQCAC